MNASSYTYHLKEDLDISEVIVATHNNGKWGEFEYYLRTWPCSVYQGDFLAEPEETGKTFIENAILKARAAAEGARRARPRRRRRPGPRGPRLPLRAAAAHRGRARDRDLRRSTAAPASSRRGCVPHVVR